MFGLIKLSCTILGNKEIDLPTVIGVPKDCLEIRTPALYQHPNSNIKSSMQPPISSSSVLCLQSDIVHAHTTYTYLGHL